MDNPVLVYFSNTDICNNITNNCFGRGQCGIDYTAPNATNVRCFCPFMYLSQTFCQNDFYEYYQGYDAFYWIWGLISTLPLNFLCIMEVILHVIRQPKKIRHDFFITKVSMAITFLVRTIFFILYSSDSVNGKFSSHEKFLATQIVFNVYISVGASTYMMVLIVWIFIATKMEKLTDSTTTRYKVGRKILWIEIMIFSPIAIINSILWGLALFSAAGYLYAAWIAIAIILNASVSLFYAAKLHKYTYIPGSKISHMMRKKNLAMIVASCGWLLLIILYIIYTFSGQLEYPWKLVVWMTVLRTLEVSLGYIHYYVADFFTIKFLFRRCMDIDDTENYSTSASSKHQTDSTLRNSNKLDVEE